MTVKITQFTTVCELLLPLWVFNTLVIQIPLGKFSYAKIILHMHSADSLGCLMADAKLSVVFSQKTNKKSQNLPFQIHSQKCIEIDPDII